MGKYTGTDLNIVPRKKRRVLITGGTGTLGRAILRRAKAEEWPWKFTILSRDPVKQQRMAAEWPWISSFVVGDIRDYELMKAAFTGHDIVIHAAAQKHIPVGERDTGYTIDVNVTGSSVVAQAAIAAGVEQVVGISTDKACYPINVYGHTKALMERLFLQFGRYHNPHTSFHLCRYGNVIGSSGSVLTIWERQLEAGERPVLTHPDVTRFWIGEDEAVSLVLIALQSPPGSIVVPLAPAAPVKNLGALLGIGPDDFNVVHTLRWGEKLHETLITAEEGQCVDWSKFEQEKSDYVVFDPLVRYGPSPGSLDSNNAPLELDLDEVAKWLSK